MIALIIVGVAFKLGNQWWGSEASANGRLNYRLPNMTPSLTAGSLLRLHLDNPNEAEPTRFRTEQPDRIRWMTSSLTTATSCIFSLSAYRT